MSCVFCSFGTVSVVCVLFIRDRQCRVCSVHSGPLVSCVFSSAGTVSVVFVLFPRDRHCRVRSGKPNRQGRMCVLFTRDHGGLVCSVQPQLSASCVFNSAGIVMGVVARSAGRQHGPGGSDCERRRRSDHGTVHGRREHVPQPTGLLPGDQVR